MPGTRPKGRAGWTVLLLLPLLAAGCGTRVGIVTGTTIGLKATPGNGSTRPPQITFGYRRAEAAIVPTKGAKATPTTDAYSTLAAFHLQTEWFGDTEITSFIGTGTAAKGILGPGTTFTDAFAAATLGVVPEDIQARRKRLADQLAPLTEDQAKEALALAGYPTRANKTAKESLQDGILDAVTDAQLMKLESAFNRIR